MLGEMPFQLVFGCGLVKLINQRFANIASDLVIRLMSFVLHSEGCRLGFDFAQPHKTKG
jgi:hypothetical protein